jgi:hypothetical protein
LKLIYYIPGKKGAVIPGSSLWDSPLSRKQDGFPVRDVPSSISQKPVTIGEYFHAAGEFISKKNFHVLKAGTRAILNTNVEVIQISNISFSLEKHGAFYHPIKVVISLKTGQICQLALNGAVSRQGLALVENECQLLSRLNFLYKWPYIPAVYGSGIQASSNHNMGFFLSEWFEGFKEFHVTNTPQGRKIVLWGSGEDDMVLSFGKALKIYEKISTILTMYYNIETYEQIFPWHHAAGDFIVKLGNDNFQVKLITVRGYSALTEFDSNGIKNPDYILPGLLFFFLNLSLRIQIDRIDGTEDIVWLGESVAKATVRGFLDCLNEKSRLYDLGDIRAGFIEFYHQFDEEQVASLCLNILESYNQQPSEILVLQKNLGAHCKIIHKSLQLS